MDRRAIRSRESIISAFQGLLASKPYRSITVGDVIERSGVGRSTFYAHFPGKEAVLQELVDRICAHVAAPAGPEPLHDFSARDDSRALVEHTLCHLREQESGIRALLFGESSEVLVRTLRERLLAHADRLVPARPSGPAASLERPFLLRFVTGSFLECALWWAREGFDGDPARVAAQYLAATRPLFGR